MDQGKQGQQNNPVAQKQSDTGYEEEEQIPEHFYDSDMASVHESDFQSDNEPPKDITYERKLLYKEKFRRIYKTILRVGEGIDKPAPYDWIRLRFKSRPGDRNQVTVPRKSKKGKKEISEQEENNIKQRQMKLQQNLKDVKSLSFLDEIDFQEYNLGIAHKEIQTLVISMKMNQAAMYEVQELEISQKSNIKVLKEKMIYVIDVDRWTTVIDIDGDREILKYIVERGSGPHRVHKFYEVTFQYEIQVQDKVIFERKYKGLRIEEEQISEFPKVVWKILATMKKSEKTETKISLQYFKSTQQEEIFTKVLGPYLAQLNQLDQDNQFLKVRILVSEILPIDDFYLDGSILKKTIIRGVSTSKPDSGSFVYYALKFMDSHKNIIKTDECYNSDWWEDFGKLDLLGCRKNYLDEYKISKFLKASIKRMKPAEVAQIQCRDLSLFAYGQDYEELQSIWPENQAFPPKKVFLQVRVYNFTEAKTCFNMQLDEKVEESRRKKKVAVFLLNKGDIKKAYKRFQNIVAFYSSGKINQEAYDQKISALMNSVLCLMKQQKYAEMLPLCEIILQSPKHGYDQDKMKINGPQGIKIQGQVKQEEGSGDDREAKHLVQNPIIIDKCLYRKSLALARTGEGKQALECLGLIKTESEQVKKLRVQAVNLQEKYEKKSKKMFKQMFGE